MGKCKTVGDCIQVDYTSRLYKSQSSYGETKLYLPKDQLYCINIDWNVLPYAYIWTPTLPALTRKHCSIIPWQNVINYTHSFSVSTFNHFPVRCCYMNLPCFCRFQDSIIIFIHKFHYNHFYLLNENCQFVILSVIF